MTVEVHLDLGAIERSMEPEQAVRDACRKVEEAAKRFAPVDTGELRGSISSSVTGKGANTVGKVSASAGHATHVEYGTSKTRAQPFLRPALRSVGGGS